MHRTNRLAAAVRLGLDLRRVSSEAGTEPAEVDLSELEGSFCLAGPLATQVVGDLYCDTMALLCRRLGAPQTPPLPQPEMTEASAAQPLPHQGQPSPPGQPPQPAAPAQPVPWGGPAEPTKPCIRILLRASKTEGPGKLATSQGEAD